MSWDQGCPEKGGGTLAWDSGLLSKMGTGYAGLVNGMGTGQTGRQMWGGAWDGEMLAGLVWSLGSEPSTPHPGLMGKPALVPFPSHGLSSTSVTFPFLLV